jgi:hypothetical protein
MENTFNLTPEQQVRDDERRRAWEAEQRQRTRTMPADEYARLRAEVTKPQRRAPPAPGPHVSTLTDAEYARELRRHGVRLNNKPRPVCY